MTSLIGRIPDHGLSTLALNRERSKMPPTDIIEISDDDIDEDDSTNDLHTLPVRSAPLQGQCVAPSTISNIRPNPDTSPMARRDSKRQRLNEDGPEASGSRTRYPRARLDFANDENGFTQAYSAFFDDAFILNNLDDSSNASTETAAGLLRKAAIKQARRPPYYFDPKLNIRMYRGPGHENFPLPVDYDPKFRQICDAFDARQDNDSEEELPQVASVSVLQQECLARILDVFPDIRYDFVLNMIKSQHELIQFPDEEVEMHPDSDAIINEILELDSYPKQQDSKEDPGDTEFEDRLGKRITWDQAYRQKTHYRKDAVAVLATQFDHVPTHFIHSTVMEKGNLFDAYVTIEDIESDYFQRDRPYHRSKRPRVQLEKKYQSLDLQSDSTYYSNLVIELQAAKQHVLRKRLQSNQKQQMADAEKANIEQQRINGLLVQCKCCFDEEIPMNRTVACHADSEHFFCYDCVNSLAENQIGMQKYQMQCMDESGCRENLDSDGIGKAVPIKTFDRLQFNQQQAEIKAANIEGLEQCPFCDFQAICDPIEIDTLFSCQSPDCFKVTCRKCHETSHLPKTCEEAKKDRGLSARHKIEEARTKAMIRMCPSCQSAIIKSDGCNKMRCTCGTAMCYVCKLDLSKLKDAYEHFSTRGGKCPLYDDKRVDRHVQEANEAEEQAIQEARAEDDTIEEGALRIETGKGKEKVTSPPTQRNAPPRRPARRQNNYPGHIIDFEENLHRLQRDQNNLEVRANQIDGGRAHRNRTQEFLRNGRHAQWLQDVRQHITRPLAPNAQRFEPLRAAQGMPPAYQNDDPMPPPIPQAFHNNHGAFDARNAGHGAIGQPTPPVFGACPMAAFGVRDYGENAQPNFGFDQQQLQPHDEGMYNETYLTTAYRIHQARDQQERRRRNQIERRNTIHNDANQTWPTPGFFNFRNNDGNNNTNNNGQIVQEPNQRLTFGAQQSEQNHLAEPYKFPPTNQPNTFGNVGASENQHGVQTNFTGLQGGQANFSQFQQQNRQMMQPVWENTQQGLNQTLPPFHIHEQTWRDQFQPTTTRSAIQTEHGGGSTPGSIMNRGRPFRRQTIDNNALGSIYGIRR